MLLVLENSHNKVTKHTRFTECNEGFSKLVGCVVNVISEGAEERQRTRELRSTTSSGVTTVHQGTVVLSVRFGVTQAVVLPGNSIRQRYARVDLRSRWRANILEPV